MRRYDYSPMPSDWTEQDSENAHQTELLQGYLAEVRREAGGYDDAPADEPEQEYEQRERDLVDHYYHLVDGAISEATRRFAYWDLAGLEGEVPNPLDCLKTALERAMKDVAMILNHQHDWNEDDYCTICGRDGHV